MTQTAPSARLGLSYAFGTALLFGISTPISKLFLDRVDPWMLAGLLFLGGGLGLMAIEPLLWLTRSSGRSPGRSIVQPAVSPANGDAIRRQDWGWLTASILTGGVISPVLLMFGLSQTAVATAGLLLNFEGVFTVLIAWIAFAERLTWRLVGGIATITAGGLILSQPGQAEWGFSWGSLAILGTCLMWGLDSNLTHRIADRNPRQLATLKCAVPGAINVGLAYAVGNRFPPPIVLWQTLLVGSVCYGLTLLCFVLSLRHIGAARTGTIFALSPFVSAAIAVSVLGESITRNLIAAAILMAIGVALCLSRQQK